MQTLAERCVAQKLALGCFFFSRSDSARNNAEAFIPTLVYQLAQLLPPALQVLKPIIDRDPLILNKSLQVELADLLVLTLQRLLQLGIISTAPHSPRVFLIDGLDECNDPDQQKGIIQAVSAVCHEHHIPVRFLIASRPELVISTSFGWYKHENHVLGAISLSEDPDAEADIRRFVESEFLEIRSQHAFNEMLPSEWPNLYDINRLVWNSSSHFIYASTAMKYIWSAKENPVRSLQVILGLKVTRTISPFSELDAMYHHILGSAAHRDQVLQILGQCLFSVIPISAGVICEMLQCSCSDFLVYMADMTPLVCFPQSAPSFWRKVTLHHASLGDFLCDQSRSGPLYIDEAAYLASKLKICFRMLHFHSRERTKPHWLHTQGMMLGRTVYNMLGDQVVQTIRKAGHLVATQEVLRWYGLLNYYQWRLCFEDNTFGMAGVVVDFLRFFVEVYSIVSSFRTLSVPGLSARQNY